MCGFSFGGLDPLVLIPWGLNPLDLDPLHLDLWDSDALA